MQKPEPKPRQWGLYPWFKERGTVLVHPDDLEQFQQLLPYGKVFEHVTSEGGFLVLRYADRRFQVKPDLFKAVAQPEFQFGEQVTLVKGGVTMAGAVADIIWHFKQSRPFYHLTLGGTRLSKRYWEKDLEHAADRKMTE